MAKKPEIWQDIEEQAFHAYREWSLWLVLRVRELQAHQTSSDSSVVTEIDNPSNIPTSHSNMDTGASA
jgi:hypothetical protein